MPCVSLNGIWPVLVTKVQEMFYYLIYGLNGFLLQYQIIIMPHYNKVYVWLDFCCFLWTANFLASIVDRADNQN